MVAVPSSEPAPVRPRAPRKPYVPAIGPRLRTLFWVVLVLLAFLGANSAYLFSVTGLEALSGHVYQNYFYQMMFLVHVVLGLLLIVPFVVFGTIHMLNTRQRKNRRAVRVGYALFAAGLIVLISGVLLMRAFGLDLRQPAARSLVYWLHVAAPLVAGWLYWLHRLAGPPIQWRVGGAYVGLVGATIAIMLLMHSQDPRKWNVAGPQEG